MAAKPTNPTPAASHGLAAADYALLAAWLQHTSEWWDRPAYPRREQMRGLMLRLMVLAQPTESAGPNTPAAPRKKGRKTPG